MKHNVRTINGKRIVGGDPNLATKNEIHVSKIPEELGISGGESGGQASMKYYHIDGIQSNDQKLELLAMCPISCVGTYSYIDGMPYYKILPLMYMIMSQVNGLVALNVSIPNSWPQINVDDIKIEPPFDSCYYSLCEKLGIDTETSKLHEITEQEFTSGNYI